MITAYWKNPKHQPGKLQQLFYPVPGLLTRGSLILSGFTALQHTCQSCKMPLVLPSLKLQDFPTEAYILIFPCYIFLLLPKTHWFRNFLCGCSYTLQLWEIMGQKKFQPSTKPMIVAWEKKWWQQSHDDHHILPHKFSKPWGGVKQTFSLLS